MPVKPQTPCRKPGCSLLWPCPVHEPEFRRAKDEGRATAKARGYDARWGKVRKAVLSEEPFCRLCSRPSEVVDHVLPMRKGGHRFERSNLQALCKSCHDKKTAREDGGFGNR